MPNLSMRAMNRLRFSIKNEVNQNAVAVLQHQIDTFINSTGLEPRGVWGVAPPEGMDQEQAEIYNEILQTFINESKSAQEIKNEYKNAPSETKFVYEKDDAGNTIKHKPTTIKECESVLRRNERIKNDERLRPLLYSGGQGEYGIMNDVFTLAKDNDWDTDAVYKAMVDTLDELERGDLADSAEDYVNAVIDKMRSGLY